MVRGADYRRLDRRHKTIACPIASPGPLLRSDRNRRRRDLQGDFVGRSAGRRNSFQQYLGCVESLLPRAVIEIATEGEERIIFVGNILVGHHAQQNQESRIPAEPE